MTPCEERGYKVGQVFEVVSDGNGDIIKTGGFVVLCKDDDSKSPKFFVIKDPSERRNKDTTYVRLSCIKRIYPPEEKKIETIELMGKTYDKAEIEKALSGVMPVS